MRDVPLQRQAIPCLSASNSCSSPSLNPQVWTCNGAMCMHQRETLTTRQGKYQKKEGLDFTCAFAGTFLSLWVYAVIPMGISPPTKIQAQILRLLLSEIVWGASTESDREVPSLASALPSCLLRLTSLFPFHFGGPIQDLKYLHSVWVNTTFSVIIPAAKIIFLCAFWAWREGRGNRINSLATKI